MPALGRLCEAAGQDEPAYPSVRQCTQSRRPERQLWRGEPATGTGSQALEFAADAGLVAARNHERLRCRLVVELRFPQRCGAHREPAIFEATGHVAEAVPKAGE